MAYLTVAKHGLDTGGAKQSHPLSTRFRSSPLYDIHGSQGCLFSLFCAESALGDVVHFRRISAKRSQKTWVTPHVNAFRMLETDGHTETTTKANDTNACIKQAIPITNSFPLSKSSVGVQNAAWLSIASQCFAWA